MKIPGLGKIAAFALNRVVLPAIGRAIADGKNPLRLGGGWGSGVPLGF